MGLGIAYQQLAFSIQHFVMKIENPRIYVFYLHDKMLNAKG